MVVQHSLRPESPVTASAGVDGNRQPAAPPLRAFRDPLEDIAYPKEKSSFHPLLKMSKHCGVELARPCTFIPAALLGQVVHEHSHDAKNIRWKEHLPMGMLYQNAHQPYSIKSISSGGSCVTRACCREPSLSRAIPYGGKSEGDGYRLNK